MGLKKVQGLPTTNEGLDKSLESMVISSLVLQATPAVDVEIPPVNSIAIFINLTSGKLAFKKSDGSVIELGGAII